jgi:predicted metalloprotease with PDZ domain
MIHYRFYYTNPATQYIHIEVKADVSNKANTLVRLSKWRPGRYELGNFAKNIKGFIAVDSETHQLLPFEKLDNDTWQIHTKNVRQLKLTYQYYANELNAGSSFLNHLQLYVNPVNCAMYFPDCIEEACTLHIDMPQHFKIAIGLEEIEARHFKAENFHELADSPFISSPHLRTIQRQIEGYDFYFDFIGECAINTQKLDSDFTPFIKRQLAFFGDMPSKHFRFLFQVLPYRFYHGVEHKTTTVIALGPGYNLFNGKTYEDLLGVSCHELFHVWNIKSIRPKEMWPYDYTKENLAKTGFVYEGFTTYYGDLLLYQSKVFDQSTYFDTLEERITKHFHNDGRFNLNVTESSFETWLDGYVIGTPGRKTSIYDEGNLLAFILDIFILEHSNSQYLLENVLYDLYHQFFKNGKAYEIADIIGLCSHYANADASLLISDLAFDYKNFKPYLMHAFEVLGLQLIESDSDFAHESLLGMKLSEMGAEAKVIAIADNSPAYYSGLSHNDTIIAINGLGFQNDLSAWLQYFINNKRPVCLTVKNAGNIKEIRFSNENDTSDHFFNKYKIKQIDKIHNSNYKKWALV